MTGGYCNEASCLFLLTDAMCTILRLQVHLWIPVAANRVRTLEERKKVVKPVEEDDNISRCQIDAEST